MRETFSSVPTAYATPLSLSLSPLLPRTVIHTCVRACVSACVSLCIAYCVPLPKAQVSRSEVEGVEEGGHRRRWTARDAACLESLFGRQRRCDLCVFSYASERGVASFRFLLPPLAAFIHRRHIRISRRNRDSEKYVARRMSHRSIFLLPYSTSTMHLQKNLIFVSFSIIQSFKLISNFKSYTF